MNILITNDDGWGFDGIKALEGVARQIGNVWIVAPEQPMSGISHQLTFERPMRFIEKSAQSYSLDGTPADCVRVAMTQLGVKFDWVFSGINRGANLGSDIYVSGTVAAAREAGLFNCRAIALSQHLRKFNVPFDWQRTAAMAAKLIPDLLARDLDPRTWVNVNFPDVVISDHNIEVVNSAMDLNPLPVGYCKTEDGSLLYNSVYNDRLRDSGSDVEVCMGGKIAVTTHSV